MQRWPWPSRLRWRPWPWVAGGCASSDPTAAEESAPVALPDTVYFRDEVDLGSQKDWRLFALKPGAASSTPVFEGVPRTDHPVLGPDGALLVSSVRWSDDRRRNELVVEEYDDSAAGPVRTVHRPPSTRQLPSLVRSSGRPPPIRASGTTWLSTQRERVSTSSWSGRWRSQRGARGWT